MEYLQPLAESSNRPIPITVDFLESIRYQDDQRYFQQDIPERIDIEKPTGQINRIVDKLATIFPGDQMISNKISINKVKDPLPISTVQYAGITLTIDIVRQFKNIIELDNDLLNDRAAQVLATTTVDGICYYGLTGTLAIPRSIVRYLHNHSTIYAIFTIYDLDKVQNPMEIFRLLKPLPDNIPQLDFVGIPDRVAVNTLKETAYGMVMDDHQDLYHYLFVNLPYAYYKNCTVDCEFLSYNLTEQYYQAHSDCNISKINHLAYDIATNGLQSAIQFKLLDDGNIIPYFSNKRYLIARYLQLPEIPAIIILDKHKFSQHNILYRPNTDLKDFANQLFAPYFTFL